jgi:hypothetical protein
VDYTNEELHFESGPHLGDLGVNVAAAITLIWLPLTIAAIGRAAFVKYKFTNMRLSVITTAPWKSIPFLLCYEGFFYFTSWLFYAVWDVALSLLRLLLCMRSHAPLTSLPPHLWEEDNLNIIVTRKFAVCRWFICSPNIHHMDLPFVRRSHCMSTNKMIDEGHKLPPAAP